MDIRTAIAESVQRQVTDSPIVSPREPVEDLEGPGASIEVRAHTAISTYIRVTDIHGKTRHFEVRVTEHQP